MRFTYEDSSQSFFNNFPYTNAALAKKEELLKEPFKDFFSTYFSPSSIGLSELSYKNIKNIIKNIDTIFNAFLSNPNLDNFLFTILASKIEESKQKFADLVKNLSSLSRKDFIPAISRSSAQTASAISYQRINPESEIFDGNALRNDADAIAILNFADLNATVNIFNSLHKKVDPNKLDELTHSLLHLSSGNIRLTIYNNGFIYFCEEEIKNLIEQFSKANFSNNTMMLTLFNITINKAKMLYNQFGPEKAKEYLNYCSNEILRINNPLNAARKLTIGPTAPGEITVRKPINLVEDIIYSTNPTYTFFGMDLSPWASIYLDRRTEQKYPTRNVFYQEQGDLKYTLYNLANFYEYGGGITGPYLS
ncbi:MAG: hypothetical protein N3D10_00815, partial [Candidatus Micrarchaeota archaeon]|nr:hypothetical protein [Candidatus Micrarchaeota archaeon]